MEETVAQAYTVFRFVIVAVVAVAWIVAVIVHSRVRPYSPLGLGIRGLVAIGGFAVVLLVSGVAVNWLWAAVFGVVGAGVGFVAGRRSKRDLDDQGRRTIKRSPWPIVVSAVAYVVLAWSLVFAPVGVFAVAMLVVFLGAMMQAGAAVAEILAPGSTKRRSPAVAEA